MKSVATAAAVTVTRSADSVRGAVTIDQNCAGPISAPFRISAITGIRMISAT